MDSYNQECTTKCPYRCANRQEIGGFEKVIELKDMGFIIYCQNTDTEKVQGKRTIGGIILQKDKEATGELETQLDVNKIPCAPCRQIIRQAKVLLDKAPGMNSSKVLGICEHCRSKALYQSHESCNDCEEMIKVFLLAYSKQEDDLRNYIKKWLINLKSLLEKIDGKKMLKSGIRRAHSDIDLDQLKKQQRKSPRSFAATSMFQSDEKLFDTESSKNKEQLDIEKTRLEREQKIERVRPSSLDEEFKDNLIIFKDKNKPPEPGQKTSAVAPGKTIQKSRPSLDKKLKQKGDDKKHSAGGIKDMKTLKGKQGKDKENELDKQKLVDDKNKKDLDDKGAIIKEVNQEYYDAANFELKRIIAEREKEREEGLKKKRLFELELKRHRELAQQPLKDIINFIEPIPDKVSEQSSITEFLGYKNYKNPVDDIIIGQNMAKYRPPNLPPEPDSGYRELTPMVFQKRLSAITPIKSDILAETLEKPKEGPVPASERKGIIRYALSNRTFIDKGWTMLPTEKIVRKMNVYRMRPAHPEFDWFERNKNKRLMQYSTGEKFAEFDDNGRGRWYYKTGQLALHYYDAEESNAHQRFVVYSSGEPDERGRSHPITILATFDYLGNGIVFDHSGKIRLKYNQTEGVLLDRSIGPVSNWKWHTLNDPPVLQQVMMDTEMSYKDETILKMNDPTDRKHVPHNEDMLTIEYDNFVKEKDKKLNQKFKPFQIKMKALKINEHFSLRILDQATIYLIFRDGSTIIKLNIGMILDHKVIVDTDTAEVGEVSSSLERLPARTNSLAALQRTIAHAHHYERNLAESERRLRPTAICASADKLIASTSRPLRSHVRTLQATPSRSASNTPCCIYNKKPPRNLYYNSRLM